VNDDGLSGGEVYLVCLVKKTALHDQIDQIDETDRTDQTDETDQTDLIDNRVTGEE
jgi:hypothetical protein